jgi:DNA-binding NarL/FixJ family response regulator
MEQAAGRASIVIADSSEFFVRGLTELLSSHGFEVLGSARSAAAAFSLAAKHPECVLLLDEAIAGDGALVPQLLEANPGQHTIVMNGSWSVDEAVRALAAGAGGIVNKACSPEYLFAAIDIVVDGGIVFSGEGVCRLRDQLGEVVQVASQRTLRRLAITEREAELLRLLPSSMTLTHIAARLYVSRKTIQNNASTLYRKLGAGGRAEAVARAIELGLLAPTCAPARTDAVLG